MGLPVVSMEDEELFPKDVHDLRQPLNRQISGNMLDKFLDISDQIWWSRLIISARGYVINHINQRSDEHLFSLDDAFIFMHKVFAERSNKMSPIQFITHINTLLSIPDFLFLLNRVDPENGAYMETHPFFDQPYTTAFEAFFGNPQISSNLHTANLQKIGFDVFARLLGLLLGRYARDQVEVQKHIKFNVDPEWQPSENVVLFEEFGKGNRTWILMDFDRYILDFWRPNGVHVIFGDSYIDKKRRAGYKECSFCGMLEQIPSQFPEYNSKRFCSERCFASLLDNRS